MTHPDREAFTVTASELMAMDFPRARTTHTRQVACDTCGAAADTVVEDGHEHAVVALLRWLEGPLRRWHVLPRTPGGDAA